MAGKLPCLPRTLNKPLISDGSKLIRRNWHENVFPTALLAASVGIRRRI
jgi:hypothetical protein